MQTPFGLRFVPFPGLSHSGDQVFGERGSCNLLPPPSLLLGFLGVLLVHLLRRMSTIENPKKSWLAMKPACSFVDDASLGPQLPPYSLGCPCLQADSLLTELLGNSTFRKMDICISTCFCVDDLPKFFSDYTLLFQQNEIRKHLPMYCLC